MLLRGRKPYAISPFISVEFVTWLCIVCAVLTVVASQSFHAQDRYAKRSPMQRFVIGSRYGRSKSSDVNSYKRQRSSQTMDPFFLVNGRYGKRFKYPPLAQDIDLETNDNMINYPHHRSVKTDRTDYDEFMPV